MFGLAVNAIAALAALELVGLVALVRGYLKWSGRHRRWYRTATLGERMVMVTIFGGGPLIEIVLGLMLAILPPVVLTIHYGLYTIGYVLMAVSWMLLISLAFLYTVRPRWAYPQWMREQDEAAQHHR